MEQKTESKTKSKLEMTTLLTELAERKGSDLHLVMGLPPVFRVDGALVRRDGAILDQEAMEALLFAPPHSVFSEEQQAAFRQQRCDIEITLRHGNRAYRCHLFKERGRPGAAIRAIPQNPPTLDDLYPPDRDAINAILQGICRLPRGLVLVTGPTGSGKSTTCVSVLETINRTAARRIVTLEDSIDYEFTSRQSVITQRNIGDDVESYEQGAYWAFHEDLDVIYIDEMRTLDVVQYALALAESGHLVLSTMHTATVSEAINRLTGIFPEPRDMIRRALAQNMVACIAQQLVPRSDRPGRVAANEILLMKPHISALIEAGETNLTAGIEAGRAEGMQTMDDSILHHYHAGVISLETAQMRIKDKTHLTAEDARKAAESAPA